MGNAVDVRENRDMKYMGYMRDTTGDTTGDSTGATPVFVLGKRWAWDSQVLQSLAACCVR